MFSGLETITLVDLSVCLGLPSTNPIATLLSMPECNNSVVMKWVVDLLIQTIHWEEITILQMVV